MVMVSESGASVYSASEAARAEFPDLDLTYRGAVSIGRRLADPLAELVKIDPKSIGVGQYQHDVNQSELKRCLDDVVVSCVNAVGVDLNTASEQLLTYVSGLGPTLARNIVAHRHENGPFQTRRDLLKVPRLGPKAFEQCSGFLRIRDGKQPLDASAVHPEAYAVVERMAKDTGTTVRELMQSPERRKAIRLSDYVTDKLGLPTLTDIMKELAKTRTRPARPLQALFLCRRREHDAGSQTGHEAAGHCHQYHSVRRVCGHRRASGRARPHQPAGEPLRARSQRSRQSASGSARHRARRGHPPQAHFLDDARRIGKKAGKRRGSGMLSLCVMNPKERNSPDSSAHVPKKFLRDRSGRA